VRKGVIRPLAICIFKNEDSILVAEGFDSVKKDHYYRPIGGGIEYGEPASEAIKREVYEEIEADITNLNYVGTVENIFTYNGDLGHEIVMVYEAEFVDQTIYHKQSFAGKEDDGTEFRLVWLPMSEFLNGKLRLVPEALIGLIPGK
jgi:8-oxo-dGTP pyrophosphatase MutT (NUDIX family)